MIKYTSDSEPKEKHILLRVDFNVSLNDDYTIADDERIQQSLPTIRLLLKNRNKLILISHLGRPKGRDQSFSLSRAAERLQSYLEGFSVTLVPDFLADRTLVDKQIDTQVLMLENIRFYEGEKKNDEEFAKSLAALGDTYVDDAFAVCHREDASVVGLPKLLPSYSGLLLEKEIKAMDMLLQNPEHPFVAILAGAKISTKLPLIRKMLPIVDTLLLGGGIANTLFLAQGMRIGKSIAETELLNEAKALLDEAGSKLILPTDGLIGKSPDDQNPTAKPVDAVSEDEMILDIGPETQKKFIEIISQARTITWNGPIGYFENPVFRQGSMAICKAITDNTHTKSVVGGGETITAIGNAENLDRITHISTGGGAMLEYLEKGTLPGIEALK